MRKLSEIEIVGRDAPGFFLYGLSEEKEKISQWKDLEEIADVVRNTFLASKFPEQEFYLIELNDVDAVKGEVNNIQKVIGKNVKGGKVIFRSGDVIFARIEPSIYNKKTALVPDVGECIGSTEFLVARPKDGTDTHFLLWILRSKWVEQQILGKMTGSTGRRRFEDSDFAKLKIPWVEPYIQKQIASILISSKNRFQKLVREAQQALEEGEAMFEEILQGNSELTTLAEGDLEILNSEDKWNSLEKLYLPQKEPNEQLKLGL